MNNKESGTFLPKYTPRVGPKVDTKESGYFFKDSQIAEKISSAA